MNTAIPIMSRRFPRLIGALCALAFCTHQTQAAPAATNESGAQLTIELRDGSRLIGKSAEDTLAIHSTALGEVKFPWAGVRSIEYAGTNTGTARLTATNGDAFAISLDAETLRVDTAFGQKEMPVKLIRSVKVSAPGAAAVAGAGTAQLSIELRDGSHVVGKGLDDSLTFHSAAMGDLKMTWAGIRSIEYQGTNTNMGRLTATNGDVYEVQFEIPAVHVETSFGKTELPVKSIRSVKVSMSGGSGHLPSELSQGLVSLWSGEGNCSDAANGHDGTLCGNATFADGKAGQAFSFDGVNSYVKIPQSPELNPGGQITIAFWMKAAADNQMNSYQGLVASDFYGISIANGRGGRIGVDLFLSTTGSRGTTTVNDFTETANANGGGAPVTAGQWHHVAGTYDGSRLQLYIDGRPWGNSVAHTGTITPMLPNSFVAIGSEDGRTTGPECIGSRYFKGLIDEVAIFNRALSAAEIQALCTEQNNGEAMPATTAAPPRSRFGGEAGGAFQLDSLPVSVKLGDK